MSSGLPGSCRNAWDEVAEPGIFVSSEVRENLMERILHADAEVQTGADRNELEARNEGDFAKAMPRGAKRLEALDELPYLSPRSLRSRFLRRAEYVCIGGSPKWTSAGPSILI
jgi:hypothetical protein